MTFKNLFIFSLLIISCGSKKTSKAVDFSNKINTCPTDGNCKLEILKNKSIEFNYNLGKLNYSLINNEKKIVVKYEYSQNTDKSVVDGGYREEIIFEIDSKNNQNQLINLDLQKTKMLFGRYCFCRGQTGLYKVIKGDLNIKNTEKLNFELNFTILEVPQITKNIVVKNNKL